MAYRLSEYVVYGEIKNTNYYSTSGFVVLRGGGKRQDTIIRLNLTGDCKEDLRGRHICFQPSEVDGAQEAVFRVEEHPALQLSQIGPTGTISASGRVRVMPCAPAEFMRRAELGEPPPTQWKRRLCIEWYGQNGRIVIELADPVIEECVREPSGKDDEGEWAPFANDEPLPPDDSCTTGGLSFTIVHLQGADATVEHWGLKDEVAGEDEAEPGDGLIPGTLQKELDAQTAAVERAIRGQDDTSDRVIEELELLDRCIEEGDGDPISYFLGDLARLPRPEGLDDETVEAHLKSLLARLAAVNVTLDVCEHMSARDCYRVLLDDILPECTVYKELVGTGNITHLSTYDYCSSCTAELDALFDGPGN